MGHPPTLCYEGDFYPYGAESIVTNTCPQNYKWTGKERDAETGNDNFDARYYSSVYGRFLSEDWSAVPVAVPYANLTNPQTLNLYAIVRDNPESFADLDGHMAFSGECWTGSGCLDQQTSTTANEQVSQGQAVVGQGQTSKDNCGFWCKLGRAFGFVETEEEKKATAQRRDWINKHYRTSDGKPYDASHLSDRQVNNLFNMIQFGLAIGGIPSVGPGGAPKPPADPAQSPGSGWEWRGKGAPGTEEGSWYNPSTNESLHPDLSHPDPIGPHWDYIDASGNRFRIFPDGTVAPK